MKRLTLTTVITLPNEDEHFLYRYLEQNGFGNKVNECKNTGGFDRTQESQGITVTTKADITDVTEPEPSKVTPIKKV